MVSLSFSQRHICNGKVGFISHYSEGLFMLWAIMGCLSPSPSPASPCFFPPQDSQPVSALPCNLRSLWVWPLPWREGLQASGLPVGWRHLLSPVHRICLLSSSFCFCPAFLLPSMNLFSGRMTQASLGPNLWTQLWVFESQYMTVPVYSQTVPSLLWS